MSMFVFALLIVNAAGHGSLSKPPSRNGQTMKYAGVCAGVHIPTPIGPAPHPSPGHAPVNGTCDWYSQGCQPGCSKCNVKCGHIEAAFGRCCKRSSKRFEPTLPNDPKFRTFQNFGGVLDIGMKFNPWRSPGFAPVQDPCGVVAGDQPGESIVGGPRPGFPGSKLPALEGPNWAAGSQQEVSWSLYANHGGGYSYRLCPRSSDLTEDCFQKHHLQFVGNQSWIEFGDDGKNRTQIPATRVSEGTNPTGSQWTKNPIPACAGYVGGAGAPFNIPFLSNCNKAQFEPPLKDIIAPHPRWAPLPGLYGFGVATPGGQEDPKQFKFWSERFGFNIVDRVQIPADLAPGGYVLSFRWDAEQTPQVWNNCADIVIASPESTVLV